MAVGERDEVAGGQRDALAVLQLDVGPAFAEQMVDDHVRGPCASTGASVRDSGDVETPGLGELRVEVDGRVEPDDAEDFRERIHRSAESSIRLSGVSAKNPERWVKSGARAGRSVKQAGRTGNSGRAGVSHSWGVKAPP